MADVFDVLSADHAEVKRMLAELEAGPDLASGITEAQVHQRRNLTDELIMVCSRHEAVEEQFFWPAVRERVPGGDQLADHAVSQEETAKSILASLGKVAPSDAEFDDLMANFIPAAREHIRYEETQVWPPMRQALGQAEAMQLGQKLTDAKKTAPTRPHPATPASPGVLKAAGPAMAAVDRLRDIISERGQR